MTIEDRVKRLEETNRRLMAAIESLLGRTPETKENVVEHLRVTKVSVVDDDGVVRAVLGMTPKGPELSLLNDDEEVRAVLSLKNDKPALRFFDEEGRNSTEVGDCQLSYFDENNLRVRLDIQGGSGLSLLDANGKPRAVLTSGPGLILYDETGHPIWMTK